MDLKIDIDLKELQDFFREMNKIQKACPKSINTERLILQREKTPDGVSTVYSIILKQTEQKIGNVTLIQDGEIWYKVYEPFRKNGYATEAVAKVMEVVVTDIDFYLSIRPNNKASRKVAKKLGFVCKRKIRYEDGVTMIFKKK